MMDVSKVDNNVTGYMDAIAVSRKQHVWCIALMGQPKAKFISYIYHSRGIYHRWCKLPPPKYAGLKVQRRSWSEDLRDGSPPTGFRQSPSGGLGQSLQKLIVKQTKEQNNKLQCQILIMWLWSGSKLLVGQQEGHPTCKNWVVGCWHGYVSGSRCRFAYGPVDATATHYLLHQ